MSVEDVHVRQAIDYLLGIDTTEHWPDTDSPIALSPEDYGVVSAMKLAEMTLPTAESMAALIHGALKHNDGNVKVACGEALARIDCNLAKAILSIQTMDSDSHVRAYAFNSLWHIDPSDQKLACSARDRLLSDADEFVQFMVRPYQGISGLGTP